MPTYDYVCDACKHESEVFQMMSAKPLKKCPECGKNKLRRLIGTGAGVIFKGSGFYETDYRSAGYNKDKKADGEKKSDAPTESKADAKAGKPETKADAKPNTKSKSSEKKDA